MEKKSRILIVGATGKLGFEIAKASLQASHPTYALVRDSAFSDPLKSLKLQSLSDSGATLLKGSLQDETSLIEAIKQVDVVICAVSLNKSSIRSSSLRLSNKLGVSRKAEIRHLVEAEGIPHTYICCNYFMSYLLPSIVQPGLKTPPRDKFTIFGNGNVKGVFMKESDVAAFTISAVDDPRTLNKAVHLRPQGNVYSMNELVELWESKIGKKLEKIYVPEEELLKKIKVCELSKDPYGLGRKSSQSYFSSCELRCTDAVKDIRSHAEFEIELLFGLEALGLNTDAKYVTVDVP
ncbi:hypothetical protein C3L33_19527, partial [Rhododendron williamsianum]